MTQQLAKVGHNGGPALSYDVAAMPYLLQQIYGLVGAEAMEAFIGEYGGIEKLYIPKEALGSKLAKAIGEDAAGKIVAKFGGQRVDVPLGTRRGGIKKTQILALKDRFYTHSMIARKVGTTQSYVRRILRDCDDKPKPKKQYNQPSLF